MKKKKKQKVITKARYLPIQNRLDAGISYAQAAFALDKAAQMAISNNQPKALTTIAALWIELAAHLGGIAKPESPGEYHETTSQPMPFGFGATPERLDEDEDGE